MEGEHVKVVEGARWQRHRPLTLLLAAEGLDELLLQRREVLAPP
jgi:hypothetical protein